jgi:hypothetical protein
VEYKAEGQKELIRSLLRTHVPQFLPRILAALEKSEPTFVEEGPNDPLVDGFIVFLVARACLKSAAFDDEREWRMIKCTPVNGTTEQFRPSKGLPLPYWPIVLKSPDVPITGIMVGPGANQERKQKAIERFVAKHGLAHVEVTRSQIPVLI